MNRKEEIEEAAKQSIKGDSFEDGCIGKGYFIIGAEWADENPDERMIAKYLYEKKGYPIDLNGNLPSFEETMKAVEEYYKYKEDKLIEKVCERLRTLVYQEYPGGPSVRQIDDEQLEKLRKIMKGE